MHVWRRWLPLDAALNLAVFRITVALVLLSAQDVYSMPQWAALPESVRVAPQGLGPLLAQLPTTSGVAWTLLGIFLLSLTSGLIGFYSRTSFLVATVTGFYVLGVPQLAGTTLHYHHLLWFTALLATSPCGDALSVDAWRARRHWARSAAYGVPIRVAWLLLGIIFFFPGLWKLRTSGWDWIWSENLRNQLYWKWMQTGHIPWLRIDRLPLLCRLGALGVVAFELSFGLLVLFRRTRLLAVVAALLFHAGAAIWMDLHYSVLWCCYTVLIDWDSLLGRSMETEVRAPGWPALITGVTLLVGSGVAGAAGLLNGWPFACYPTFQWKAGTTMPALVIEIVRTDGDLSTIPDAWLLQEEGATHHWGLAWSLTGVTGEPVQSQRLADYWANIVRQPRIAELAQGARSVRFSRALVSVIPEERDRPPVSRELLYELELGNGPDVTSNPRARSGSMTRDSMERAASAR